MKTKTKITTLQIESAYDLGKKVYYKQIDKTEAVKFLIDRFKMSVGSAEYYISHLQIMLAGKKYSPTLNAEATEYYLENILKDFDTHIFKNALSAVEQHLEYRQARGERQVEIQKLLEKYGLYLKDVDLYPDEVENSSVFPEGAKSQRTVNAYERSIKARRACLKVHGYLCNVCGFDFLKTYGKIGKDFIHVHHILDIAVVNKEYQVDGEKDLIPVCPNCHAMLHREKPAMSLEKLRAILKDNK